MLKLVVVIITTKGDLTVTLIKCLMKTGLTRHESELYVALCREGDMNGYEAAKAAGIPRANAYQALAGLVEKGGAYMIEGPVLRYAAVPVEEYCRNVLSEMNEVLEQIKRECPRGKPVHEPYITISGFRHIVDKMRNMIRQARERVYVSLSEKEMEYIREELCDAVARGLKVVVISSAGVQLDGALIHTIQKKPGPIRIITDSREVLTGEITGSDDDSCLYSRNRPLVELIKDSLKNEILLSNIGGSSK
jgi:Archaeal transcriptional regulator TrmB./Sugar-specific transcriptional regulator TrmB.